MIFLSHKHDDKPIIEPIALQLREIFGEDQVFYDSWSIQPGNGIIDRMNTGIESAQFFFFFVSQNSLKNDGLVTVEWQNALHRSTKGKCRFIPIRSDECDMPAILTQNCYIDLCNQGIERTVNQMVNLIQGNNSFAPQYKNFSNLTCKIEQTDAHKIKIIVSVSHFVEHIDDFALFISNTKAETSAAFSGFNIMNTGFIENIKFSNGFYCNAYLINNGSTMVIRPKSPTTIYLSSNDKPLQFHGVYKKETDDEYSPIPPAAL